MIDIPYDHSTIHRAGRWLVEGGALSSRWASSQLRFKISGSLTLALHCQVSGYAFCALNVDDGPAQVAYFSGSGLQAVVYDMPDAGEHTIVVKLVGVASAQWSAATFCRLQFLQLDDGGEICRWGDQSPVRIACVGDSWMAAENDWPYLLGFNSVSLWPTASGGATAATLDSRYPFDGLGMASSTEPEMAAILVNASVNDLAFGVSDLDFRSAFESLVDKITEKHPESLVALIQTPRHVAAGLHYDRYGTQMEIVAATRPNCVYIPCPPDDWASYEWTPDDAHLTFESRGRFAMFIKGKLLERGIGAGTEVSIQYPVSTGMRAIPCHVSTELNGLFVRTEAGVFSVRHRAVHSQVPTQTPLLALPGKTIALGTP